MLMTLIRWNENDSGFHGECVCSTRDSVFFVTNLLNKSGHRFTVTNDGEKVDPSFYGFGTMEHWVTRNA